MIREPVSSHVVLSHRPRPVTVSPSDQTMSDEDTILEPLHAVVSRSTRLQDARTQQRKCIRRRWTEEELCGLSNTFTVNLQTTKLPSGADISKFIISKCKTRSVEQVRAQLHNIISGKVSI